MVPCSKNGLKYLIDYKETQKIRPSRIFPPITRAYRTNFGETKYMS